MTTTPHLTPPGQTVPDVTGHFGIYGGSFAPEALTAALDELTEQYLAAQADPEFQGELARLLRDYAGRPTLITEVPRFAAQAGGGRIFLKREDLAHTGSHKINNVLGQALLTRRMGKTRVIAETGAGQHGVATATACALFGLEFKLEFAALQFDEDQQIIVAAVRLAAGRCVLLHGRRAKLLRELDDTLLGVRAKAAGVAELRAHIAKLIAERSGGGG